MDEHYNNIGMMAAHNKVKEYYASKGIGEPDKDGIIDLEVSFDGTWMTQVTNHKYESTSWSMSTLGLFWTLKCYATTALLATKGRKAEPNEATSATKI